MKLQRLGLAVMGGVCGIVLSLLAMVYAEHLPSLAWMAQYKSANGMGCCSGRDCKPATIALIQIGETETTVLIQGTVVVLPSKSVHPSEDGQTYRCSGDMQKPPSAETVRCVFYAVGT